MFLSIDAIVSQPQIAKPIRKSIPKLKIQTMNSITYTDEERDTSQNQKLPRQAAEKKKDKKLTLKDYLYLTNTTANSIKTEERLKLSKKEYRKEKYGFQEQKVLTLMDDELNEQLEEVIDRIRKIQTGLREVSKNHVKVGCTGKQNNCRRRRSKAVNSDKIVLKNNLKTAISERLVPLVQEMEEMAQCRPSQNELVKALFELSKNHQHENDHGENFGSEDCL